MRLFLLFVISLSTIITTTGQTVEETYPKTLWCPNDTFILKFKGYEKLFPFKVSRTDKGSPGTNGGPGEYFTIYYGKDSLRLNYHNKLPYAHIIYIPFESPKGKTTLRFHYNELANYFPPDYIKNNTGNIQFDLPETYELANIIWTLSPSGKRGTDLYTEGEYYTKVVAYFKPYLNHPVFKALNFPDSLYTKKYLDFRENSFAFNFQDAKPGSTNTKLLYNGPYYYVNGSNLADSSLFGIVRPLVEDFAVKSKFRQFYKNNSAHYTKQIQRQKELLPVKQMWIWLEKQFPKTQYQSYRIVFSPLINRTHSTQHYATHHETGWFEETVMFICGPDRYDIKGNFTEKQKEGLLSGVVFTEIDHNYVNPETDKYTKQIDSIFSKRSVWAKPGPGSNPYISPVSVFNEYMTHAAFCMYISDTYDKATADFVIDNREDLMVSKRDFIRFKEFDRELIRLHQEQKALTLVDLYPLMLNWCKQQVYN
ncbi:DUF4932 domain-containing protein [Cytophagaceae bacterium DM2B3-1]|uniref:DUF4932 domain-containing protein n=1 Tax=Xanthocytophaga flava TaxID=3048013 RepID=A0ABT7CQP8_9BACT|nr:DUF4932 domain-containing protein [Xanthocytophaga flavus]MDJ1496060.1 DUF4932 domain-containing protein [Xanthocytophaga flavus]